MYGPVATRHCGSVEMSLYGIPAGTAKANGIAMMSRNAPSGCVRWNVIVISLSSATMPEMWLALRAA